MPPFLFVHLPKVLHRSRKKIMHTKTHVKLLEPSCNTLVLDGSAREFYPRGGPERGVSALMQFDSPFEKARGLLAIL